MGINQTEEAHKIFLGFDGFVDTILRPIQHKSRSETIPFKTTREFAEYLTQKAGDSCSIDLEAVQEKIGGNMPIAANALGNLGCQTYCVGAMGDPALHPIFKNMSSNCQLLSVSEPGYCSALEFQDGKLMLATNTAIDQLNYQSILRRVPEQALISYLDVCEAVAFLNWGELIQSNDIWENIRVNLLPRCSFPQKKILLVDFSDFSKRCSAELGQMLKILQGYTPYFDITISLNENEMKQFWQKLACTAPGDSFQARFEVLHQLLPCQNLVVHMLDCSYYSSGGAMARLEKEVVRDPKVVTGGGDNFNAGLLFGLLQTGDLEQAVRLGSALSCLYVKTGGNISRQQLEQYDFYK